MGNKKSTSNLVLREWFIDLNKNPLIISRFDLVELSELHKYINDIYMDLFKNVYDFLNLNPSYSEEWGKNSYSQYGCNLNRFEYLLKLINEQFDVLNNSNKHPQLTEPITKPNLENSEGDLVFLNNDKIKSELFFNYLVDKWLRNNEPKVKTALKHITFKMYYKNSDENKNTPFKIRSSLNDFAIYWNKNFNEICELNPKNPHLNIEDLTSSNYYSNKFKYYLDEYQRG